jgi:biotin transport system permease protein
MRNSLPLGIHQPGTTLVHRASAGWKLLAMLVFGIGVVALRGPWPTLTAVGLVLARATYARIRPRTLIRGLRPVLVLVAILAGFQWWQRGWPTAVELAATTVALVIAATVVTATTPSDAMLDAISRGLSPFRRLGVNPEKVALSFSLMIGAIPRIFEIATETREAAKARGLERSVRAQLSPMAIRTVAHAHAMGEALTARGIGDD